MDYSISYDKLADALYIKIKKDKVDDSIEIESGIIVDLNKDKEIIGIEVSDFSKKKDKININELVLKGIESVVVV